MTAQINVEAEEKAIITLLGGSQEIVESLLPRLQVDTFGFQGAQECFIRIETLFKLSSRLPSLPVFVEDPTLSDEARSFIKEANPETLSHVEDVVALCKILDFHRKYRMFLRGLRGVSNDLKDQSISDLEKPTEDLEKLLLDIRTGQEETQLVIAGDGDSSHADEIVKSIVSPEDTSSRIYTGFGYFDRLCGGFRKPSVVVIAGTTGGGKSVMRTQLCKNMYFDQHLDTCIVSMEMSEEEEVMRLLSNISQVPFDKIERHQMSSTQQAKVLRAWEQFKQVGVDNGSRFMFWVPNGAAITASSIVNSMKVVKPHVVVVDYIGLLASGSVKQEEAQWQALGDMARDFKIASSALNCCFIILAQFDAEHNRIRYSRAVQEHCNILWGWTYGEKERETGVVTIQQIKNRNALSNIDFRLMFQLDTMTILDYVGDGDAAPEVPHHIESPRAKTENKPPRDFSGMKKDINKYNKDKTYIQTIKPAMTPDTVGDLDENDQ